MSFICHTHNYTEYNQQWNVFWIGSRFEPPTSGYKSDTLSIRAKTAPDKHQTSP